MKFNSRLTEATLLKRSLRFLADVVLPNRQKLTICCPNLSKMIGCDILGTKLWYSNPIGYNCLPTWELAEGDGGHLISINPLLMKPLVIEAIRKGNIQELQNYNVLHTGSNNRFSNQLLLEKNGQQCYVGLEQVILGDSHGTGYFPESIGEGQDNLKFLMQAKADGYKAIIFYCVMHTGINYIRPANHIDQNYMNNLQLAISKGIEILAYKTAISLQDIELTAPLSMAISKDTVSR